jgi:hypothetical protein
LRYIFRRIIKLPTDVATIVLRTKTIHNWNFLLIRLSLALLSLEQNAFHTRRRLGISTAGK